MNFLSRRGLTLIQVVVLTVCFLFPMYGHGAYDDECTGALPLPGHIKGKDGTPQDWDINGGVYCLEKGDYKVRNLNIHGEIKDGKPTGRRGKLIFRDATINLWANSILVENEGSLIAGSADDPIGRKDIKNTVTIHLYGNAGDPGITCRTTVPEKSSAPDFICGVPRDKWNENGSAEYQLPGGVSDRFYAYRKTDLQDVSGGTEGSYFGRKVLAVSYGGTLQMFGRKGALYPNRPGGLNAGYLKQSYLKKKQVAKDGRHLELDKFVDWKPGTKVALVPRDGKTGPSGVFTIDAITAESGDYHSNITIREPGIGFSTDRGTEYMVIALDPSGTSWARLVGSIKEKSKSLTLDREVDWQEDDRIVVTTTDYLPGHSEELTVRNNFGRTIKFDEEIKYLHNGEKYSLAKHAVPDRLVKEGFGINEAETRAAVALLTRNIRIVSDGDAYGNELAADSYFGGHTIVRQGFRQYQVQGVEFRQLGQGGRAARMPVNFFLTRKAPGETFVRDCSVNESMTHWIELRGAHDVYLERNVGYKSIGHGFVLAEGTEIGSTLSGNIGILARAAVENRKQNPRQVPGILTRLGTMDNLLQDAGDAVHPSVFFIGNGYNNFENNMASGAGTCGACYWVAQARGGISARQFSDPGDYAGLQNAGRGSAPIKSFTGNYCSTAQHSLMTIGSVGVCPGVVASDTAGNARADVIKPLPAAADHFNQIFVKIDSGSSLNANLAKGDCREAQEKNTACVAKDCAEAGRILSECMVRNHNDRSKCEKENEPYAKCADRCAAYLNACNSSCTVGYTENCAVTVIDRYTSSFHWASTNVSAVWLRTNWFLMTDSVLTDVLNGGLTMVSGGTYDQVINGYWALTRRSAFIGHTQEGNPYATNAGPISPGSPLQCEANAGFCAIVDEGVSYPAENFSVYQRLYNIYDGPVYQEANAFLNIKETPVGCSANYKPDNGKCNSPFIYGSGGRGLGIPVAQEGRNEGKCILPNAAIGWKQPNGFYYPPAFYSRQLYFDDVDLRHFIIIPLFKEGSYQVEEDKVRARYCTYNPSDPGGLFAKSWTDVDRQTELNDIDGTLSGLINTISVNNDSFFSVPMKPEECLSEKTCFQVPYDYVTAVVFPARAEKNKAQAVNWAKGCKTQDTCQGVPIYRQLLTKDEKGPGPGQMARMMGGEIYQRSVMAYNNGVYYIDTAADSTNQFMANDAYDFFLLYPKENTKITLQIYVGDGFKMDDDKLEQSQLKPIRVYVKRPEAPGVNKDYGEREMAYKPGINAVPMAKWNPNWKKTYENGILTVTMDMTGPEFRDDFDNAREEYCKPSSFCKWDKGNKKCVYANAANNPSPYNVADADKICEWAIKAPECPNGGCYGFQVTMPPGFDSKQAAGKRPAPRRYAEREKDWCLKWDDIKWKTPAGERVQKACDYFSNGVDLPGCN